MDGEIKRALQSGDEEDEEWVWSGQMCSNVFWPDLCKDKNMSTHTSQSANISIIYSFMLPCGGGPKKGGAI